MAYTRLTNSIRESIKNKVLSHKYDSDLSKLVAEEADFAEEIYKMAFSEKQKEKMESLPDGWLPTIGCIRVSFSDNDMTYKSYSLKEEKRVPNSMGGYYHTFVVIDTKDKIYKKLHENHIKQRELNKERAKAAAEIDAITHSVTTVKRLLTVWPEAEKFILPYMDTGRPTVPAIKMDKINEMLDLPPKGE